MQEQQQQKEEESGRLKKRPQDDADDEEGPTSGKRSFGEYDHSYFLVDNIPDSQPWPLLVTPDPLP